VCPIVMMCCDYTKMHLFQVVF